MIKFITMFVSVFALILTTSCGKDPGPAADVPTTEVTEPAEADKAAEAAKDDAKTTEVAKADPTPAPAPAAEATGAVPDVNAALDAAIEADKEAEAAKAEAKKQLDEAEKAVEKAEAAAAAATKAVKELQAPKTPAAK
jgi:electron transport complex protein RnfC